LLLLLDGSQTLLLDALSFLLFLLTLELFLLEAKSLSFCFGLGAGFRFSGLTLNTKSLLPLGLFNATLLFFLTSHGFEFLLSNALLLLTTHLFLEAQTFLLLAAKTVFLF